MEGSIDGRIDRWKDRLMEGSIDGRIDGWKDR